MKQLYENLWQTCVEHPFSGLNTHAYFLQQTSGNLLFYNTSNINDLEEMAELGGVTCQYLSHRHESAASLTIIKSKFNSKLCSSALEAPFIDGKVDERVSIQQGHRPNLRVIPTPGHTAGSLCFYYQSNNGLNYLFTGDTFFQSNGQWSTLVFPGDGGSAAQLITSLLLIRALKPQVVLSSASVGKVAVVEITEHQWHEAIDENVEKLSK